MRGKRNRGSKIKKEEQGYILLISLLIMTMLLLLTVPFLFNLSTENSLSEKSYRSLAALSLAEAGVERAIWELNHGDMFAWSGDSTMRTMAVPSFQSSAEKVMGDIDIKVTYPEGENPVVESTGSIAHIGSQSLTSIIRVVLNGVPDMTKLFDHGAFGDDGVELQSQALVDSYDSRQGEYGGTNIGEKGDTGTNATHIGAISLNSNATIYGNAIAGPESDPEQAIVSRANGLITGESLALSSLKEMPSVTAPDSLPFRGSYLLDGDGVDSISVSGEYTSFGLDNSAKLTITDNVILYITGEFSMLSNTQLDIAQGVEVTIYLGGSFTQTSNTQINNLSQDPTGFMVFGTDSFNGTMQWNSNTEFYGAVYAPKATIEYNSNADFYGSIAGSFLNLGSNTRIHYDEALGELKFDLGNGEISSYEVRSWQQKSMTEH